MSILLLLTCSLVSNVTSTPTPIPNPIVNPFSEYGSRSLSVLTRSLHRGLSKLSETTGTVYGIISLHSPYITESIMTSSIKMALDEPILTSPLAKELGRVGALAFVGNKNNGMLIVRAANEGIREVLSQAIKNYFSQLGSKLSSLAVSLKNSVFSKIPGLRNFVPPDPQEIASEIASRPQTWTGFFIESYRKTGVQLALLQVKVNELVESGFQFSLKASSQIATVRPETIQLFGKTSHNYGIKFVSDAEHQQRVAREFGRVAAREFLKNPSVASTLIFDISKGAAPVLYEEYTTLFSQFVRDLRLFVSAASTAAMNALMDLAEKILADMRALLSPIKPAPSVSGADVVGISNSETKQVGSEIAQIQQQLAQILESKSETRNVGFEITQTQQQSAQNVQVLVKRQSILMASYEKFTPENDIFLRDLHETIVQFQKLGHLIYFKSISSHPIPFEI